MDCSVGQVHRRICCNPALSQPPPSPPLSCSCPGLPCRALLCPAPASRVQQDLQHIHKCFSTGMTPRIHTSACNVCMILAPCKDHAAFQVGMWMWGSHCARGVESKAHACAARGCTQVTDLCQQLMALAGCLFCAFNRVTYVG